MFSGNTCGRRTLAVIDCYSPSRRSAAPTPKRWRVASGEWRVASGEWRVASGEHSFGQIHIREHF